MWLLHTTTLRLKTFFDQKRPHYAILSHVWWKEEISFQQIQGPHEKLRGLAGFEKIRRCCARAASDGFDYVWIDTCCIDKTNSTELSEAINSMFSWYLDSTICYVYMVDVDLVDGFWPYFSQSKWFQRGWTLQELIAPSSSIFLDKRWTEIGTKASLRAEIVSITNIPDYVLLDPSLLLSKVSVAQIMSWASNRETTRVEDKAYCLLGLFGVHMPMIYGEGQKAFTRLQNEIIRISDDHSIFAWKAPVELSGLLAPSPAAFNFSADVEREPQSTRVKYSEYGMTNRGLHIYLPLVRSGKVAPSGHTVYVAWLNCRSTKKGKVGIYLTRNGESGQFQRIFSLDLVYGSTNTGGDILSAEISELYIYHLESSNSNSTQRMSLLTSGTVWHVDYQSLLQSGYRLKEYSKSNGRVQPDDIPGKIWFYPHKRDSVLAIVFVASHFRFAFVCGARENNVWSDIEAVIDNDEDVEDIAACYVDDCSTPWDGKDAQLRIRHPERFAAVEDRLDRVQYTLPDGYIIKASIQTTILYGGLTYRVKFSTEAPRSSENNPRMFHNVDTPIRY